MSYMKASEEANLRFEISELKRRLAKSNEVIGRLFSAIGAKRFAEILAEDYPPAPNLNDPTTWRGIGQCYVEQP